MRSYSAVVAICLGALTLPGAQAATLTLEFSSVFSGIGPGGSAPWVTAAFTDVAGGVRLDIQAIGISAPEGLHSVYFNLDPALVATSVNFAPLGGKLATVSRGEDKYKADGDGKYDFFLEFGTGVAAMQGGEFSRYLLSGPLGLTVASFNFLSQPAGGHGPFLAASHIQGTGAGGGDSGWVSASATGGGPVSQVPLPAALGLLASALGAMLVRFRRK
ncbi:MAG: hypothetical protein ACKVQA_10285 [Burkholderiales bacterium]